MQIETERAQGWPYLYQTKHKTVKKDKEGQKSITVKQLTNQEDITIKICIYANIRTHKYIKQI